MAIPTRFIEAEEFEELLELEDGDTIPIYKLTAIPFNPPRPIEDGEEEAEPVPEQSIRVMLLPVVEPRLYKDPHKAVFVVFPSFDNITYEAAQDMHPVKEAWAYRFTPYHWDGTSPLVHATYLLNQTAPVFELGNTETH